MNHEANQLSFTSEAAEEERRRKAMTEWVEARMGGRVSAVSRLRRWRPIWRIDYEKDGRLRTVLVRSIRPWESIPYSLNHEMLSLQILKANGIPVPEVYGAMDYPEAFVMEWIDGGRDPGLVQQAIESNSTISPDRWKASLKYMEQLARIHAIPVEQFAGTEAGNPATPAEIALDHYERNYQLLATRNAVDSLIAFFTLWLKRNVPQHRNQRSFVTGDCGQFLSKGEDITAILDVEIGHIGDPFHDLACFRGRHPVENMGDVPALFRHYAKAAGIELDLPVIAYHTVCFLALATIAPMVALIQDYPGGDWAEAVMQVAFIGRRTLDAMAEIEGVTLGDISLPKPQPSPLVDSAIGKLLSEINRLPTSEIFPEWQRGVLASIPDFLASYAHYGRWVEEEELKDLTELLGHRPADIVTGEAELKAYVEQAGADQNARLIHHFHRRLLRMCRMLAGPDAPETHLLFAKVEPILHLDLKGE